MTPDSPSSCRSHADPWRTSRSRVRALHVIKIRSQAVKKGNKQEMVVITSVSLSLEAKLDVIRTV